MGIGKVSHARGAGASGVYHCVRGFTLARHSRVLLAGIHRLGVALSEILLKTLDSRFRGNDELTLFGMAPA
jgi:hypothetical protein